MRENNFVPHHMKAQSEDFEGNGKWGRYIILPGSDGRASTLASSWSEVQEKRHPRAHNLYIGKMKTAIGDIDVATISTGMGAASADIIINELNLLGAKNLIRVGTAGSLQHKTIRRGALVVPTGSVRDEASSLRYLPAEVPAIPSLDFLIAARASLGSFSNPQHPVFFGPVHAKDSLYAREFLVGPQKHENERYMKTLKAGGILASEMETSILFTLGGIFDFESKKKQGGPLLTGAVLSIIGDDSPFGDKDLEEATVKESISFVFKTIENLHGMRTGKIPCNIPMEE